MCVEYRTFMKKWTKPEFEMRVLFSEGRARIPKITVTTNDTVIAFARNGTLMRRSTDRGQTWGGTHNMASSGGNVIVDDEHRGRYDALSLGGLHAAQPG